MRILDRIRLLGIFVALVRNPLRTELIFKAISIGSKYKDDPLVLTLMAQIKARPGFEERFAEHYLPDWPTLEGLKQLPQGSFGEALYKHLHGNGLDLNLFPRFEPRDELDYLNARAYQDHDLWHALLGYGTELEDELGLQAFTVAQFGAPMGSFIISGGILHLMIKNPLRAAPALKKISEGYRRGEQARFLLGMKLVDMLPRPLGEVQQLAGVA